MHKYGNYSPQEGWDIQCACSRQLARLQVYHLLHCLRAGDRPAGCVPAPPPGRTLVEFAAAAWLPFHNTHFRDRAVPGHHREPAWLAFAAALERRLAAGQALGLAELTEAVYGDLIAPVVEEGLRKDRPTWAEPCPFGAFSYTLNGEYAALHFHNVYMPGSPFREPAQLVRSLRDIAADLRRREPGIGRIGVDSWVNNLRPFQALFPPAYGGSLTPTDPDSKGGLGWWGQFILRTGHFNEERAQRLRQTRQFDFLRLHGECAFEDFCRHIERDTAEEETRRHGEEGRREKG